MFPHPFAFASRLGETRATDNLGRFGRSVPATGNYRSLVPTSSSKSVTFRLASAKLVRNSQTGWLCRLFVITEPARYSIIHGHRPGGQQQQTGGDMLLNGRIALVTGAGQGNGAAIAIGLAA